MCMQTSEGMSWDAHARWTRDQDGLCARCQVGQLGREDMAGWPPAKVLFMNDVYFCAKDAVRLLLHNADIACGMDYFHKFNDVRMPPTLPLTCQRVPRG